MEEQLRIVPGETSTYYRCRDFGTNPEVLSQSEFLLDPAYHLTTRTLLEDVNTEGFATVEEKEVSRYTLAMAVFVLQSTIYLSLKDPAKPLQKKMLVDRLADFTKMKIVFEDADHAKRVVLVAQNPKKEYYIGTFKTEGQLRAARRTISLCKKKIKEVLSALLSTPDSTSLSSCAGQTPMVSQSAASQVATYLVNVEMKFDLRSPWKMIVTQEPVLIGWENQPVNNVPVIAYWPYIVHGLSQEGGQVDGSVTPQLEVRSMNQGHPISSTLASFGPASTVSQSAAPQVATNFMIVVQEPALICWPNQLNNWQLLWPYFVRCLSQERVQVDGRVAPQVQATRIIQHRERHGSHENHEGEYQVIDDQWQRPAGDIGGLYPVGLPLSPHGRIGGFHHLQHSPAVSSETSRGADAAGLQGRNGSIRGPTHSIDEASQTRKKRIRPYACCEREFEATDMDYSLIRAVHCELCDWVMHTNCAIQHQKLAIKPWQDRQGHVREQVLYTCHACGKKNSKLLQSMLTRTKYHLSELIEKQKLLIQYHQQRHRECQVVMLFKRPPELDFLKEVLNTMQYLLQPARDEVLKGANVMLAKLLDIVTKSSNESRYTECESSLTDAIDVFAGIQKYYESVHQAEVRHN